MRQRPNPKCEHCQREGRSTLCRHRTPLRSTRQLSRSAPPKRRVGVKRVNKRRREAAFNSAFGGESRFGWVARQPCVVPGCFIAPSENAHVRSRGAGGKASDIVPLCHPHHTEQHQLGIRTFEAKYGLDLAALARETDAAWVAWCEPNPNET